MPLISLEKVSIALAICRSSTRPTSLLSLGSVWPSLAATAPANPHCCRSCRVMAPDSGNVWRQPGATAARLVQDLVLQSQKSVFDVVAEGLGDLQDIVTAYHHAAHEVAEHGNGRPRSRRSAARSTRSTKPMAGRSNSGSSSCSRSWASTLMCTPTRSRAVLLVMTGATRARARVRTVGAVA